jgi:hypothetical protein
MPNSNINSNAAASIRDRSRGEHASAERDVYLGEHGAAKRVVLCFIVLAKEARRDSASDVQAIGREAAADEVEGSSVLSEQGAVRADG